MLGEIARAFFGHAERYLADLVMHQMNIIH